MEVTDNSGKKEALCVDETAKSLIVYARRAFAEFTREKSDYFLRKIPIRAQRCIVNHVKRETSYIEIKKIIYRK